MPIARILAVLCLMALQGCGDCTSIGSYGFYVTIQDNTTQRAPKTTVTATVTDGDYVEQLHSAFDKDPPQFIGASEREGRYQLRIEAQGYQTIVRNNLHVGRGGQCNDLKSITLTINLIPVP